MFYLLLFLDNSKYIASAIKNGRYRTDAYI